MDRIKRSQITIFLFILTFLGIFPLLPSSLRPTYLYLILNIFIISLGAQSGLISFISTIPEDYKKPFAALQCKKDKQVMKPTNETETSSDTERTKQKIELLQKLAKEKFEGSIKLIKTMKKFSSMPTEATEVAEEYVEEDYIEENVDAISEEELYAKAETFIGNFYKQLKIQSEESWQKIDGVPTKHFQPVIFLSTIFNQSWGCSSN